ncbi:prostaglandin E receptor 2b subtype EP2 [Esox lucius]|uniref:G-protein coupled receptors family 1 profile domain-containing protein n=1 Tax=Esox lucius TaxID=8010 RepID=A0A6Q2Z889_ESOLU|nr:prostaglandin E receptor 2b subtype EP2 [Esox lucius]
MDSESNCTKRTTVSFGNAFMSAGMFSAGVLGNFIALVLLEMRRRRQSPSLFQVLVTALVTTDLVGTFSVSPLVLTSYTQNKALVAMRENNAVCAYFGFSMTFLSLATLAIVCAMALERYLSFGHPYFHEQHLRKRCGYITIAIIYLLCLFFCLGPFMGFGEYIQYCPGTWCFFDINPKITKNKVYVYIYASLALMMILTTVICNLCVVYHLILMYRRRKVHRVGATRRIRFYQRSLSMAEEVEHLLLLIFITGAFVTCSFPLVVVVFSRPYFNLIESESHDLLALRLLSFNSIIDPWVFIILSPSVLRFLWKKLALCKAKGPREPPQFRKENAVPVGSKLPSSSPVMEIQNNEFQ